MRLEQRIEGRMEQRQELRMNQQLIQKLELLQLPAIELQAMIEQELRENPALEQREEEGAEAESPEKTSEAEPEESAELVLPEEWLEEAPHPASPRPSANVEDLEDRHADLLQNLPEERASLQDHLLRQVEGMDLKPELRRLVEFLIGNLDEDGYLRREVKDARGQIVGHEALSSSSLAEELSADPAFAGVPREELARKAEEALVNIVQKLDPPGVGARTLQECLLLQLSEDAPFHDIKKLLIENHLQDIAGNRLPALARQLVRNPLFSSTFGFNQYSDREEVYETLRMLIADIQGMDPKPGRRFRVARNDRVTPEIFIRDLGGGHLELLLNDSFVPDIFVNPRYARLLQDPRISREQKAFIRKKIADAHFLVDAVRSRRELIERVARRILDYQRDFFLHGIEFLKPLKMKTLAEELGVHISTISRTANRKYVQCPQGIFPLKFFFSSSATRSNARSAWSANGRRAKLAILDQMATIVAAEDKRNPLSDEQIMELLRERGIQLSRRVITKYRMELKIPPAKGRRVYA